MVVRVCVAARLLATLFVVLQPTIDSLCETYVSKGIEHDPGLRFAINIDPAQFQVYSAPQTGKAWSLNVTNGTSPSVVFVPTTAGALV